MIKNLYLLFLIFISTSYSQQTAEDFFKLGLSKYKKKEFNDALVLMEKAIELDSLNYNFHHTIGKVFNDNKEYQKAEKHFEKAISINGDIPNAMLSLALLYHNRAEFAMALDLNSRALNLKLNDSEKVVALVNRGTHFEAIMKYELAKKCYLEALKIDSNSIAALANLADVYSYLGDYENSIRTNKELLNNENNVIANAAFNNLGMVYTDLDSLDLALETFNDGVKKFHNDPYLLSNRATVFYKKKEYQKAINDLTKSLEIYPTNAWAFKTFALVYIALGKKEEACAYLWQSQKLGFRKLYGPEVNELIDKHCK